MALKGFFCFLFAISFATHSIAQFLDDFSDGNLSNDPTWHGDTSSFLVNAEEKLQLSAPTVADEKSIHTASASIENAVWEFEVQLGFNPSSSNYADVYLVMDTSDHTVVSGYFVRIGNTQDEISLYRQDGAGKTKIIDGRDKTIDQSVVIAAVRVTRDKEGFWQLFSDVGLTGNFEKEGEIFDDSHLGSSWFAVLCKYTATRSNKFFFDNIKVSGNTKSDIFPPSVINLSVIDDYSLRLSFSEKVSLNTLNPEMHFLENCNLSQPENVEFHADSILLLTFNNPFPENLPCQLLINNISDRAKNILADTSIIFEYVPPRQPEFNELLITEIMADQTPNVELPEYEYLEIFNPLDETLLVKGLQLKRRSDTKVLDDFEIGPEEYIILCPNPAVDAFSEFGKAIGISNWKALLNNGDTILLLNRYGEQVFSIAYQKDWYDDYEKAEGGYSLEMIDTNYPCGESANWKASESAEGGTPGRLNSIRASRPDLTSPFVENVYIINPSEVLVNLNERAVKESIDLDKIIIDPPLALSGFAIDEPLRKSFLLKLEDQLVRKQIYTLSIRGIKDCAGNLMKEQLAHFVLPEKADSLDILFNEVLFNPLSGSNDFIELVNVSDKYINLKNWKFLRETEGEIIQEVALTNDHFIMKPGDFFVFTEGKNALIAQYPHSANTIIVEAKIPQMNNDEGTVVLADNEGKAIDRLYYHEDYHHHMIMNKKGVSLERISNFSGSDNPEIWQSAASTVGFATPGLKNSQFMVSGFEKPFSIEPPVFNPNNDGYKDFASISFELENNFLASLFVYDISGRVVKQLLNNQNLPSQGFVIWEGDDEHGNKVSTGNYIIYFELIGKDGERKVYKDKVAVAAKF